MAEFNAVNAALIAAGTHVTPAEQHGRIRIINEKILTVAASHVVGSTIVMGVNIPKDAQILSLMTAGTATLGGTATLAWGLRPKGGTLDPDALVAAATHTNTSWALLGGPALSGAGVGFVDKLTAESDLVCTVAGAALADGVTLFSRLAYVLD